MYDINILLKLEQVTDRERSGAVRRNRGAAEGVTARPLGRAARRAEYCSCIDAMACFRPIQMYIRRCYSYSIRLIRTKTRLKVGHVESRGPTGSADKEEGDRPDGQPPIWSLRAMSRATIDEVPRGLSGVFFLVSSSYDALSTLSNAQIPASPCPDD